MAHSPPKVSAKYTVIALVLSLIGITSTTASPKLQSQLVFGVPMFLLFWMAISVSICLVTVLMGMKFAKSSAEYQGDDNE